MKAEDLIMASFIEAEASTTNILQPDIEDVVDSKSVNAALRAADKYYGLAKEYLDTPSNEYSGKNPMASWSYEKNRYTDYTGFSVKAKALATKMKDFDVEIGVSLKDGKYDPQEFVNWYEDRKAKAADTGEHQEKF